MLRSSNNGTCFQVWKTICLLVASDSQNPHVQVMIFTCNGIDVTKSHDFYQSINQVGTLLCNQTCWLYFKFMQNFCNWTIDNFSCGIMTFELLITCVCYQSSFWSSLHTLIQWTVNSWSNSCDIIAIELLDCLSLWHCHSSTVHFTVRCDPTTTVYSGVVLTTTILFIASKASL